MRRAVAVAVAVGVALVVVGGVGGAPAGAGVPRVEVDTAELVPGGTFTLKNTSGSPCGTPPEVGDRVRIRLDGADGVRLYQEFADVDSTGQWQTTITLSDEIKPGQYTLRARCFGAGANTQAYQPAFIGVTDERPPSTTTTVPPPTTAAPTTSTTTLTPPPSTTVAPSVEPVEITTVGQQSELGWWAVGSLLVLTATLLGGSQLWTYVRREEEPTTVSRVIGLVAVAGAVLFTVGWVVAGLVQDDLSPVDDYVSALAARGVGGAWVMSVAFLLAGVVTVLLAFAGDATLRQYDRIGRHATGRVGHPSQRRLGASHAALSLGGAGVLLFQLVWLRSDCARTDPACAVAETSSFHNWHTAFGWGVVLLFVASAFALWLRLRSRTDAVRVVARGALAFGVLMLSGVLFLTELVGPNGVVQRVFLVAAAGWVGFLGVVLARADRVEWRPPEDGPPPR